LLPPAVGMQRLPQDDLREALTILGTNNGIDNQTALRFKQKLAQHFREQLMLGTPTNADEMGLRRLAIQLKAGKVIAKLFLRHALHDVLDQDACQKLAYWFEERWEDRWCIDISKELLTIIEESWAREEAIPPYHIYLKIAYHLSQEARTGVSEFHLPRDFGNKLFDFQVAAVKIAAHHLNKRGGVLIGDVIGLGKTLMATAVARIFEDDHDLETLILCPKNLVPMWEDYRTQYRLRARVLPLSRVTQELLDLRR
jgi:SNF2 family DNA or RNA helicase